MEKKKEESRGKTYTVFVYGTLRNGYRNHYLLEERSRFLGNAKSVCKYTMTAIEYYEEGEKFAVPLVSKSPQTKILGELYEISEEVLKDLDELEGHPKIYTRKEAEFEIMEKNIKKASKETEKESKKIVRAWIYFNEKTKGKINVTSGDFTIEYPLIE